MRIFCGCRTPTILVMSFAAAAASAAIQAPVKFTFVYPREVQRYPKLQNWLKQEEQRVRSATTAAAKADQQQAARDHQPFHAYETVRTWKVVTDTPRFLSLSLETYEYTDGAHGNSSFASIVWDKAAASRRGALSFFDPQALKTAITRQFCRRLDAERAQKRAGQQGSLPDFDACIDPLKQTLILGSSNHSRFTRIGFLIAPYEAGPYAEGTYDVTLQVTPAIVAAVKPQWRRYFASSTQLP